MSKNVVSASSHPIPSATANQRPFHIPFWRRLEVTSTKRVCARNESAFLHLIPIVGTYKGLRIWHMKLKHAVLSFVLLSLRVSVICPNTVFSLLPDGGVRTRLVMVRKEGHKGKFLLLCFSFMSKCWEICWHFPSSYVFLSLACFRWRTRKPNKPETPNIW